MLNTLSKIAMFSKKGGAADVTCDTDFNETISTAASTTRTITGINTDITLRIEIQGLVSGSISYIKNYATPVTITHNITFTVQNGDTVSFYKNVNSYAAIRIYNDDDIHPVLGAVELGTVTWNYGASPEP